jgi:hypothetical protein
VPRKSASGNDPPGEDGEDPCSTFRRLLHGTNVLAWLRRVWAGLSLAWKIVIGLGALAGAILAIVGVWRLVHHPSPLPQKLRGEITTAEFTQRQTLGSYCRDTYTGANLRKCLDQPLIDEVGSVFYVQVELTGFQGRRCCEIRYTLLDLQKKAIRGFSRVLAVANVTPQGVDDKGGWPIWIGTPPRRPASARFNLHNVLDGSILDSRSVGFET